MSSREAYEPGPASGAEVRKDGDEWTLVAADALNFGGWQRLHAEYAKQFSVETPGWPGERRSE